MPEATLSGADFKKQLREGTPKMGLFLNSHSPTVAEQLAHSGYDWLLVDTQHGPMGNEKLSAMLAGISNGGAKSMVRVGGYDDRPGIQQALDMGADGILVPYINTAEEARQAVSCCRYPDRRNALGYFPQRSMNRAASGLCRQLQQQRHRRAAGGDGRLHREYRRNRRRARRGHSVPRPERSVHVDGPLREVRVPPHVHLAGTGCRHSETGRSRAEEEQSHSRDFPVRHPRVGEFLEKGFTFISVGNDLHHVLTQAGAYVNDMENIAKEKGKNWKRRPTALF